jgi:general stress protein 26
METPTQKIHELIKKFDTAMLVTHGRDLVQHARPMAVAKVDENCDVWFFTGRDSEKAQEIEQDQDVLLVFQNSHNCYISLVGQANLVADREQMSALWKESYKVWFPGGASDPNLMLIRVTVMEAEYWDSSGFKGVRYLFEAATAYVKGTTPKDLDPELHGHVSLR